MLLNYCKRGRSCFDDDMSIYVLSALAKVNPMIIAMAMISTAVMKTRNTNIFLLLSYRAHT